MMDLWPLCPLPMPILNPASPPRSRPVQPLPCACPPPPPQDSLAHVICVLLERLGLLRCAVTGWRRAHRRLAERPGLVVQEGFRMGWPTAAGVLAMCAAASCTLLQQQRHVPTFACLPEPQWAYPQPTGQVQAGPAQEHGKKHGGTLHVAQRPVALGSCNCQFKVECICRRLHACEAMQGSIRAHARPSAQPLPLPPPALP